MDNGELEGIGPLVCSLKPEKKEQLLELLGAKADKLEVIDTRQILIPMGTRGNFGRGGAISFSECVR
ncbi:hypothetical protein GUJ93_ZPchr0001g32665 [Zizania palustris]|uniref:Uncharacterized protein n=1 Tax=Zizania palustris TaxID=103762 RepID=A0A8J5S1Z5_ZIZPA|nr:hypothetical protein GUJ93_ZPchr0001g32665 [Zizania palustris]